MNVLVCDACRDHARAAQRLELYLDRMISDPAGGASTRDSEDIDLCLPCLARLIAAERLQRIHGEKIIPARATLRIQP